MQNHQSSKLLHTALGLERALENLEDANESLDQTRERMQKLEKQTLELLESSLGAKAAQSNALLTSTRHKFRNLRTTLLKHLKSSKKARERLLGRVSAFDEQLSKHNRVQAAQMAEMHINRLRAIAMQRSLQGLIDAWLASVPPDENDSKFILPEDSHDYIPFPLENFVEQLIRVDEMLCNDPDFFSDTHRYRPVSFLEIGCGTGRNLLVAKLSGLIDCRMLTGFDLNEGMIRRGQQGLGLKDEIFVADALEFDYAPYDFVFSYRPIRTPHLQQKLEERMVETLPKGAYVMAPLSEDLSRYPQMICLNGPLAIWKKTGGT